MRPAHRKKGETMEQLEAVSEALKAVFWVLFYGAASLLTLAFLVGMAHGIWTRYRNWWRMERERDDS